MSNFMAKVIVNLQNVHNKILLCRISEKYEHRNLSGSLNILLIKHCLLFRNEYTLFPCT